MTAPCLRETFSEKEEQKMINMIQNAKDQVLALTEKAYEAAAAARIWRHW